MDVTNEDDKIAM